MTPIGRRCAAWFSFLLLFLVPLLLPPCPAHAEGGTWPPLGQLGGGSPYCVEIAGAYAYVAAAATLTVIDISDPSNPKQVAYCETPRNARDLALSGNYAYVIDGGLSIVSIADPYHPTLVGRLEFARWPVHRVAVDGTHAYVVGGGLVGLHVVDVSDPTHPVEVANYGYFDLQTVAVSGGYLYVTDSITAGLYLRVLSVADPIHPSEVGALSLLTVASDLAVSGGHVYVTDFDGGFHVIDVSDPHYPIESGHCAMPEAGRGVAVAGAYAYVAEGVGQGLSVIDVSDPAHPAVIGRCGTSEYAHDVTLAGTCAYLVEPFAGVRVIDVSNPTAPAQAGYLAMFGSVQDAAASGDHVYIRQGGLQVVDVSDPANPLPLGLCDSAVGQGLALSGVYAYAACTWDGLKVVSVADPTNPFEVAQWNPDPGNFASTVAISGNRALVGGDHGIGVADISDPTHPTGTFLPTAMVSGVAADGPYGYTLFPVKPAFLRVYNLATLGEVGHIDIPGSPVRLAVSRGYAYVAGGYPYGVWVFNVCNPANPIPIGYIPTEGAQDVAINGSYAYVAAGGLHVVDISLPANPVEVAYWNMPGYASAVVADSGRVYVVAANWGLVIFPDASAAITGQVRIKGTATGLAGATVEAYRGGRLMGRGISDAAGNYRVEGLASGDYSVTASQRNCATATTTGVTLGLRQTATVDLELELVAVRATITGAVRARATNEVVPNAAVTAFVGGEPVANATTDSQGMYLIDTTTYSDRYVVSCARDGYETQTKSPITVALGQVTDLNFCLDAPPALKGQVRDAATGASLLGARLTVYSANVRVAYALAQPRYAIYRFEATQLAPGTYKVVASLPGYVPQGKWNVTVSSGSATYLNFNLISGQVPGLKGQVTDGITGAPVIGATVTAYMNDTLRGTATTTAPWGMYEMYGGLPEGPYVVEAIAPGYQQQIRTKIGVVPGLTAYANFFLQPQ